MTPTKEMIATAERIARELHPYNQIERTATTQHHRGIAKTAALTAIMEMSEKASHHLFTQGQLEAREAFATGSI